MIATLFPRKRLALAIGHHSVTPDEVRRTTMHPLTGILGEDLFAHFTAIKMEGFKTLKEGQKVAFDVTTGPKGKQASNITAA